jgi:hypothetical protein
MVEKFLLRYDRVATQDTDLPTKRPAQLSSSYNLPITSVMNASRHTKKT